MKKKASKKKPVAKKVKKLSMAERMVAVEAAVEALRAQFDPKPAPELVLPPPTTAV